MSAAARRVLFLDRDGVINVDHGYVYLPEQTEWVPGIFELCQDARSSGFELVVVTNQAGIARGYYSEGQFESYRDWVHAQFAERGIPLLATYHCPHHPTEGLGPLRVSCECRKPQPGMILRAANDLSIDLPASALIGDKASDTAAGRAAGIDYCLQVHVHRSLPSLTEARQWLASLPTVH